VSVPARTSLTAGWLGDRSLPALVAVVALTQLVALVLLAHTFRRSRAGGG
jgi:hypothetical protein